MWFIFKLHLLSQFLSFLEYFLIFYKLMEISKTSRTDFLIFALGVFAFISINYSAIEHIF